MAYAQADVAILALLKKWPPVWVLVVVTRVGGMRVKVDQHNYEPLLVGWPVSHWLCPRIFRIIAK
jgi:hypothetical protein